MNSRTVDFSLTAMALLFLIAGCGGREEESKSTSALLQVYAAVDRYQHANSTGSRRDMLATLTPDSPDREFLNGSDQAFDERRKELNTVKYSEEYTNRRDLKIVGDTATLTTDYAETRTDGTSAGAPMTIEGKDIEFTLKRGDGTWLVYEATTPQLRNTRIVQQGPP